MVVLVTVTVGTRLIGGLLQESRSDARSHWVRATSEGHAPTARHNHRSVRRIAYIGFDK